MLEVPGGSTEDGKRIPSIWISASEALLIEPIPSELELRR